MRVRCSDRATYEDAMVRDFDTCGVLIEKVGGEERAAVRVRLNRAQKRGVKLD